MSSKKRKQNDFVDRWTLHRLLGVGGNAEVWEASRDSHKIALKILKRNDKDAESYKRFRQEILSLSQLAGEPGVLPLLDYSLPERPHFKNPAWLAMPIATQLDECLRDSSLTEIVASVCEISETLARCAEKGIFHRDIKPPNLYSFKGRSVIGDFGLVYLPDREALTKPGRKFGPLFFLPDEMLNDASSAKPGPADVFMLAKTLWVLATGQNLPPQGEIRTVNKQARLSAYWNEPQTHLLDELIERCTDANPNERPTMREVFDELSAWLVYDTATTASAPDLRVIGAKLKPSLRVHRDYLTLNTRMRNDCERLLEEIGVLLQPLANRIAQQTDLQVEITKDNHINTVVRHPDDYKKESFGPSINVVAKVAPGRVVCGFLVCGVGLMVAADVPTISLIGATAIRGNGKDELLWSKQTQIIPNSAREKQAIRELMDELYKSIPNALNSYAEHLASTEPTA